LATLSITLLTHNRTKQAFEAILSILSQSNQNFKLIVSDNSDDDSLGHLIQENIQTNSSLLGVIYIKRPQVLPALDHFNICLNEMSSDYFCLFHDDDLMLPNFVSEFFKAQNQYPDAVAFGANAIAEKNGVGDEIFFQSVGSHTVGITPKKLAERYFSRHQLGVAPFPSYIYKKSAIKWLRFDSGWGKYGDVTWLLSVASCGEIVWLNKPLMIYRLHDGNDSLTESRRDRLKFLGFIKKNIDKFGIGLLSDYRFFLYKKNLPLFLLEDVKKNQADALKKYMFSYRIYRWLRLDHHWHLLNKWRVRFYWRWFKLFGNVGW
jgi:glycosyltransferase involved in cell wall biosynthesis